ncbi:MAG: porin [Proteobacteria bacterium]|nr:porin [Pseudomonadota bacterium]
MAEHHHRGRALLRHAFLATSALLAATIAIGYREARAQSQPPSRQIPIRVSLGGFHGQFLSYVNQDAVGSRANGGSGELGKVEETSDSEIHFLGRSTLSNGITVGFQVELEANTAADQIDESWAFAEGVFGRVELGSLNNVHYRMRVVAPEAFTRGFITNDGNATTVLANVTGSPTSDSTLNDTVSRFRDNDSQKINYYTPRFGGLQLGASYVPDSSQDNFAPFSQDSAYTRGVAVAGNFARTFGAFDVAAYGGYFRWQGPQISPTAGAPDPDIYSFGAKLGYAGFAVGASYGKLRRGRTGAAGTNGPSQAGTGAFRLEGRAFDLGAIYKFGAAAMSLTYFNGRNNDSPVVGPDTGSDKFTGAALEGKYILGPGISLEAALFTAKFQANGSTGGTTGALANTDNKGTGLITGLLLSF